MNQRYNRVFHSKNHSGKESSEEVRSCQSAIFLSAIRDLAVFTEISFFLCDTLRNFAVKKTHMVQKH